MPTRMVVQGRVAWQNPEARRLLELHQKASAAKPLDREKRPLCKCVPAAAGSPGVVCEVHRHQRRVAPFRAGTPYVDELEQVTYRVVSRLNPVEGWAPADFFQDRWLIGRKELLQLARHGLLDAAMVEGSQVQHFRVRDEAAVLRSDPVLRCALKRKQELQDPQHDGRAAKKAPHVGRPRRENGQWIR